MMKRKVTFVLSLLAMSVLAQSAMALDSGTINFEGGVTETTCNVQVNGQTNNATIKLPVVSKKLLDAAGKTAGRTFLTFALTGCGLASDAATGATLAPNASVYFVAGPNINTAGRLDNKSLTGAATKVDLQILDTDGVRVVDLSKGVGTAGQNTALTPIGTGSATIRHYVQYYATAPATAGNVATSVEYEINYE